jgi:hypothetical protein
MNASQVGAIQRMGQKIMKELAGIHDSQPSPCVQFLKNTLGSGKMDRILPNVFILPTAFHVGDDPPLSGLARLRYGKKRAIGAHFAVIWDEFEDSDLPQFIDEGSG